MEPRPLVGVAAALAVVVLWAGFLLISRHGLTTELAPPDIAALRFGVSAAVMLPVLLWRGFGGLAWWRCAVLAVLGGLGFALFVYTGFTLAPAAYGAVLLPGVLPFYTAVLAWLLLGEPVTARRAVPLGLVLVGVGALAAGTIAANDVDQLWGAGCFLLGSFSWACFTIALKAWRVEAVQATAIVAVLAGAAYLPIYVAVLPVGLGTVPIPTLVLQGAYQGICAVILALLAFTVAVRHLGPSTTTMITAMTPAVVALSAVWLLDEPLTVATVIGTTAVVIGGVLAARAATRTHTRG